jgi:hypothetical protein
MTTKLQNCSRPVAARPRGRPPKSLPSERAALYAHLRLKYPQIHAVDIKTICGYAPNAQAPTISAQSRALNLDQERERLQRENIYTFNKNIEVIDSIQNSKEEHAADRLKAVQVGNSMMAFDAAKQIDIQQRSMFIELQGLTIDQLNELISITEQDNDKQ